MYSKFSYGATCAIAMLFVACASVPRTGELAGQELNLAFVIRKNLLVVSSASINGRPGRFLIGSSERRSVVDQRLAQALGGTTFTLQFGVRQSLSFVPLFADLHGVADAIIGADVWGDHAITIDYHAGQLTYQPEGIHPALMTIYRFADEPTIDVVVDGQTTTAVVDTTSPDTLVLPRAGGAGGRRTARVEIAGTEFGIVELLSGDVRMARVGNRLLSRFLITIDYGRHETGLWRDPRIPAPSMEHRLQPVAKPAPPG